MSTGFPTLITIINPENTNLVKWNEKSFDFIKVTKQIKMKKKYIFIFLKKNSLNKNKM